MSVNVAVEELSVGFGGKTVLREVSLHAHGGRMLAVTGPSGAGKTSLLWTMAGLVDPVAGTVSVDGTQLVDRADAVRRGVVLVPQGNGLAAVLTARENLQAALSAAEVAGPEADDRATRALQDMGLGRLADRLAEELSGGQRQRVAVARGLAMNATVLLADESTSDLDAVNRDLVMHRLRAEARRGAAVVVATHDPEVADACDAEFRLVDGEETAP